MEQNYLTAGSPTWWQASSCKHGGSQNSIANLCGFLLQFLGKRPRTWKYPIPTQTTREGHARSVCRSSQGWFSSLSDKLAHRTISLPDVSLPTMHLILIICMTNYLTCIGIKWSIGDSPRNSLKDSFALLHIVIVFFLIFLSISFVRVLCPHVCMRAPHRVWYRQRW